MNFNSGDLVRKFKGDYQLNGVVMATFLTDVTSGEERVVVAHAADEGMFFHIYAPHQLKIIHEIK